MAGAGDVNADHFGELVIGLVAAAVTCPCP